MRIIKILKSIREFFWPKLEPSEPETTKILSEKDCKFSSSDIELELKYIDEYKKSEETRKQNVENKATIFIGTFAVATTVLINLVKEFLINTPQLFIVPTWLFIILISITIIYLCRAILFSIEALKRRNYYTLGFPEFMLSGDADKKLQLFVKQYNCTKENQKVINLKVDYMTMAQEFFKRAVAAVIILTSLLVLAYLTQFSDFIQNLRIVLQSIKLNEYIVLIFGAIIIMLTTAVIVLARKVKKIEQNIKQ